MKLVEQVRVVRHKLFVKIDGKWCLIACGVTNTMYAENHFVATVQSSLLANRHIITITFDRPDCVRYIVVDSNNTVLESNILTGKDILASNDDMLKNHRDLLENDIEYVEHLDTEQFYAKGE